MAQKLFPNLAHWLNSWVGNEIRQLQTIVWNRSVDLRPTAYPNNAQMWILEQNAKIFQILAKQSVFVKWDILCIAILILAAKT
jgi:hypothetical protein